MFGSRYLLSILCLSVICISVANTERDLEDNLDTAGSDVRDDDEETATQSATGNCPREFRGKCSCGKVTIWDGEQKYRRYVTNCTNTGFTDASVLRSVPVKTEMLIFTGNNLTELPQNLFGEEGEKNYSKLKIINMANNQITAIHGKTFHNVKSVTKLYLDDNRLLITAPHFHPRFFSNFENLEELYMRNAFGDSDKGDRFMADLVTMLTQGDLNKLRILRLDNNTIQSIPNPDVFCSLTNLQYLHLSQNFLVDAKINISCFDRMKLLDISDNFITNLNNESLALLENPRSLIFHVNMTRNPFRCDCDFLPVFKWLKSLKSTGTWVVGVKNFRCSTGYPDRNINRPISSLKESDLKCMEQPLEQDMTGYITASYAVLISLCMALTILVAALIYSTRQHIAKGWTYLSNSLAAKREYTCLEQENKRPPQIQTVGIEEVAV